MNSIIEEGYWISSFVLFVKKKNTETIWELKIKDKHE